MVIEMSFTISALPPCIREGIGDASEQAICRLDLKVNGEGAQFIRRRVHPAGLDTYDDVAVDAGVLHQAGLGHFTLATEEFEIQHGRLPIRKDR
jgi:hypothetical protein